jgi:hypothetical protein
VSLVLDSSGNARMDIQRRNDAFDPGAVDFTQRQPIDTALFRPPQPRPFVTIERQHILGKEVLSCALELKLIDIFRGNDHRGAKNNLAIFTNRIVAKPARCKCLALLASYFALGISLRGIIS